MKKITVKRVLAVGNFMNIWSYREMEKKQEGK